MEDFKMTNIINKLKGYIVTKTVEKANTNKDTGICKPIITGFDNTDARQYLSAVDYFTKQCGINVLDKRSGVYPHAISFIIDDTLDSVEPISAITFAMNKATFIKLWKDMKNEGLTCTLRTRAINDAIRGMNETDVVSKIIRTTLNNNENIVKVSAFVRSYMYWVLVNSNINVGSLDNRGIEKLFFANFNTFGGYKGFVPLVKQMLSGLYLAIINDNYVAVVDKNKCITCKHCRFDENGSRYCSKLLIEVESDLTATELSHSYGDVYIRNGYVMSKYTPFGVDACDTFVSRRAVHNKRTSSNKKPNNNTITEKNVEQRAVVPVMENIDIA